MDYIPALNSKGRFSLHRVKEEVGKIPPQPVKRPHIGWIRTIFQCLWIFWLAILASLICLIIDYTAVKAAVFDNSSNAAVTQNLEASAMGGANYRYPYWTYTSSTLQLELTDVSLRAYPASYDATSTFYLHVLTDEGEWTASTTQFLSAAAGYTTTTFVFPYPHPWATPGTDWNMWLDAPASSTLYQVFVAATSTALAEFTFDHQYSNCLTTDKGGADCGSYTDMLGPPYYTVPQMVINEAGLGGLTIWTPPPDPGLYGLNSTSSAANQDFGLFGNLLRDLLIWLFQPDEGIKAYYEAQKDVLLNQKVPFAYFADAVTSIESVSTTISGTEMIVGATTTFGYFEFFNTTGIKANPIIGLLDVIKFWLRIAMWLGFLFWIYETLKEFKP